MPGCAAFALGVSLGFFAALGICDRWVAHTRASDAEAVRNGAGRWKLDDEGEVTFEWTTTPQKR